MSIRLRLALWVALVSLLLEAVLSFVTYVVVRDTAIAAAQADMLRLTRLRAEALQKGDGLVEGTDFFLLDPGGQLLVTPSPDDLPIVEEALRGGRIHPGDSGVAIVGDPPVWLALQTVGGHTLGLAASEEETLRGLDLVREEVFVVGITGSGLLFLIVWLVAGGVTRPLVQLADAVRNVAFSKLDAPVPQVKRRDEVYQLTQAFVSMQTNLKKHISQLRAATAEQQRMASEFEIGSEIQRTFLPPASEGREVAVMDGRLTLASVFRPYREMAGDLYDYFPLGPTRLALVIGDVSGKGLAAAMLMAVTHTLGRAAAHRSSGPGETLERVNRLLCDENRANLFVTVFTAVVDLERGTLTYANAGHLPPVLVRAAGPAALLDLPPGMVLGVMSDETYEEREVPFGPGDALVLYTDGVSEAPDPERNLFGEDRVTQAVLDGAGTTVEELLARVLAALDEFAGGAPSTDDLTLLAVRLSEQTAGSNQNPSTRRPSSL